MSCSRIQRSDAYEAPTTASGSRVKHSTTELLRKALVEVVDRAVDVLVDWCSYHGLEG